LSFLGLPWQTCRGSALLGFVGADAAALADRLVTGADHRTGMRRPRAGSPSR
jgi:putative flavoprotein involved in K+ transport